MSDFLKGNPLIVPNYYLGDVPMDTKTKASSVSEVLTTLEKENRYTGLTIYCDLEKQFYCFKNGIEDSDFIKIGGSTSIIKVSNYASLPTENQDITAIYMTEDTMIEYMWNGIAWTNFKNIADNISFNNNPNGTPIYSTDYGTVQKVLEENKKEVDLKADKTYVDTELDKKPIIDDVSSSISSVYSSNKVDELNNTLLGYIVIKAEINDEEVSGGMTYSSSKLENDKYLINTDLNNKVDKVINKSLIDDTEIIRLQGITTGANKVEDSAVNGNIKINGVESVVYTHPGTGTNPHGTTKSDIGLGNCDNTSDVNKPISNATQQAINNNSVPTGSVFYTISMTAPSGYIIGDGSSISKTTYSALYAVIGGRFGETSTTFNLPDLRGTFIRGNNPSATGYDSNRTLGSLQQDAFQGHTHTLNPKVGTRASGGDRYFWSDDLSSVSRAKQTESEQLAVPITLEGYGVAKIANETRPVNISFTPIIKL
jgi:hypothetical protein